MAIPRVVHFIFGLKEQTSPFHLAHYLCLRSCLEVNRPDAVFVHFRHEPRGPLWDSIKADISLRVLGGPLPLENYTYPEGSGSASYGYAHSSDFLRIAIIQKEGGVYADMDTLFVAPFPPALYEHPFVMGNEKVDEFVSHSSIGGSLCNALFMGEPNSTFGRVWNERMLLSFDGSWSRHSTFLPFEISQEYPETIHIEPQSSFFHLDWTSDGIAALFLREERLPASVYSLHLWAHLWWESTRTDVSRFHHGRLTPDYVAHAHTTYARYARQFLPRGLDFSDSLRWKLKSISHRMEDSLDRLQAKTSFLNRFGARKA